MKWNRLMLTVLAVLLFSSYAQAQTDKDKETEIEDIVVTAQKVEENVQDVPISTTVFNDIAITDLGIDSIEDIALYTSNLKFTSWGDNGVLTAAIRGISSDPTLITSPVGLYVDGIPTLNSIGFDAILEDIERIEVLKGPQGTLYGQNTEAGVINVVTQKPGNTFKGKARLKYGSDNKREAAAGISGPIVKDTLYIGMSARYYEKDGYIYNTYLNKEDNDRQNQYGKVYLRFTPTQDLEFSLISALLERDDGSHSLTSTSLTDPRIVASNFQGVNQSTTESHAFKAAYTLGQYKLESITSYKKDEDIRYSDYDYTPATVNHSFMNKNYENVSQELKFTSQTDNLTWLLGLYGSRQDDYGESRTVRSSSTSVRYQDLESKVASAFAHADFKINDKFSVLGGLRFDHEDKELFHRTLDLHLEDTFEAVSPKLSGKYRINDTMMAYATISKGFTSGGYYIFAPSGKQAYDSETLWNYEVGLKSQFLDKRILFNTAFYFMDISDKQVLTNIDASNGYVTNAASATSMGVEVDVTYKVTPEVSFFASFGFNQTEFGDFSEGVYDTSGTRTGTVDYEGNSLPYAPEYNYSIGVKYRNRFGWFARADVGGYGKMYLDKANEYTQDAYDLVNAKIGYEADWYDVYIYADNLFDKEYDAEGCYSGYYTIVSAPREVGVQVNLRF